MNALDTPWFVHDLTEVIEGARGQIDLVVAPKVARAEDVHVVATILASLEVAAEAKHPIGLETQIESAAGLAHCEAIAVASPRVEALVFGPGDYAASIRCRSRPSACRIAGIPTIPVTVGTTRCSASWWRRVRPGFAP